MQFNKFALSLATVSFAAMNFLAVPTAVVYAADSITHNNSNTGNGSTNRNRTRINRDQELSRRIRSRITNTVTGVADTGGNESKNNTTGGSVNSGNVGATIGLDNAANQNSTPLCDTSHSFPSLTVDNGNDNTGKDSTNTNRVSVQDEFSCTERIRSTINNTVTLVGTTGGNKATGNTTSGNVGSGDVTFGITILNTAN